MSLQIPVFKCQWVKYTHGIEVDEYGFIIVDLRNVGLKDVPGKQRVIRADNVEDDEEYNQFDEVPFFVDTARISIIGTKISYSNMVPHMCTDGEGKLLHI
jgi:hypothetical protein